MTDPACDQLRLAMKGVCAPVVPLRAAAAAAAETLAHEQAALHTAEAVLAALGREVDPLVLRQAKDEAGAAYREACRAARAAADPERERQAFVGWMREIDRINSRARIAATSLAPARNAVREALERVETALPAADAHRIRAETAAGACQAARVALASCEEAAITPPASPAQPEEAAEHPRAALLAEAFLTGDSVAAGRLATHLADANGSAIGHYAGLLTRLAATLADAAASEGFLDFDPDHPFWGQFSRDEARTLVRALAGMGYRFDQIGGWKDGRRPGAAEFAVAVAYCGYDVRGLRNVPAGAELDALFAGGQVASIEYLAHRAPSLTLDEMTALVGARAEDFGELWDHWGRLRPMLLAGA